GMFGRRAATAAPSSGQERRPESRQIEVSKSRISARMKQTVIHEPAIEEKRSQSGCLAPVQGTTHWVDVGGPDQTVSSARSVCGEPCGCERQRISAPSGRCNGSGLEPKFVRTFRVPRRRVSRLSSSTTAEEDGSMSRRLDQVRSRAHQRFSWLSGSWCWVVTEPCSGSEPWASHGWVLPQPRLG